MKLEFARQIFEKKNTTNIKFHENRCSRSRANPSVRTIHSAHCFRNQSLIPTLRLQYVATQHTSQGSDFSGSNVSSIGVCMRTSARTVTTLWPERIDIVTPTVPCFMALPWHILQMQRFRHVRKQGIVILPSFILRSPCRWRLNRRNTKVGTKFNFSYG
jgi:hypothetical protein